MKVHEIFKSIEGEGIRTGYPVTFIRLYGCNLKCSYCDTQYSCTGGDYTEMTMEEILNIVADLKVKRITITGGEPLIHMSIGYLVDTLLHLGYEVNIETNGSVDIYNYLESNAIITMDYKSPSSNMNQMMFVSNLRQLRTFDVLKFVVGDFEDLDKMVEVLRDNNINCNIFVSPIFGDITAVEIVKYLLEHDIHDVRVQLQLHKIIWDPSTRGV